MPHRAFNKLRRGLWFSAALLAAPFAANLATAQSIGHDSAPLKIYDAGSISPDRYTVLRRIWVESWRTAFYLPTHAESAVAIRQLLDEAARVGADGVVNLYCVNAAGAQADAKRTSGRHFCYGSAIKLK